MAGSGIRADPHRKHEQELFLNPSRAQWFSWKMRLHEKILWLRSISTKMHPIWGCFFSLHVFIGKVSLSWEENLAHLIPRKDLGSNRSNLLGNGGMEKHLREVSSSEQSWQAGKNQAGNGWSELGALRASGRQWRTNSLMLPGFPGNIPIFLWFPDPELLLGHPLGLPKPPRAAPLLLSLCSPQHLPPPGCP